MEEDKTAERRLQGIPNPELAETLRTTISKYDEVIAECEEQLVRINAQANETKRLIYKAESYKKEALELLEQVEVRH